MTDQYKDLSREDDEMIREMLLLLLMVFTFNSNATSAECGFSSMNNQIIKKRNTITHKTLDCIKLLMAKILTILYPTTNLKHDTKNAMGYRHTHEHKAH